MPLTTNKNVSPACRTGRRETFLKENKKLSNPFQNVSYFKIKRLAKTGEIYLIMKHIPSETRWQIDGIGVYLYDETQDHTVEYIPNISIN